MKRGIRDLGLGIGLGLRIRSVVRVTLWWHRALALSLALIASPAAAQPARAQTPARPVPTIEVPISPIECGWKTDRSAVRVGEQFNLTLTCAVLDTERVRVVVDESGLAPSALHLVPFDIVGGQRFQDILNAPRRFFQFQYTMRLLGEEFFGQEITLPTLQIGYRVQNSLQGGGALAGRETQYTLMPVPIRVLSLVPAGAADIRDTPIDTFGDVERRMFRSNMLLILATVAFVLAVVVALLLVARAAVKRRALVAARRQTVSSGAVLRAASRELGAVRAASGGGWNGDLAGRAASALRLAGAVALSRPVGQREVARDMPPGEGQILAAPGLRRLTGKKMMLSASVTPDMTAANGKPGKPSPAWESLSRTLKAFSAARYSRNGEIDGTALDAALAEGQDSVRRLRLSQWRRFGRATHHAHSETARPTWER
jgi:hypothetical protein